MQLAFGGRLEMHLHFGQVENRRMRGLAARLPRLRFGLTRAGRLGKVRKNTDWFRAHFMHDYVIADDSARRLLVDSLDAYAPFRFVVVPGIDWNSHYDDPFGEGAFAAYRRIDRMVGEAARKLERLGRYDDTLLAVVSDHGHEPVREHFDVGPEIDLLVSRLSAELSDRLQEEPDPISRVRLTGLPSQLAALKPTITRFLNQIFEPTRYQTSAALRGFYFTSGTQEGTPIDQLLGSLSRDLGLQAGASLAYSGKAKSFFLEHLLTKVVFGEAG